MDNEGIQQQWMQWRSCFSGDRWGWDGALIPQQAAKPAAEEAQSERTGPCIWHTPHSELEILIIGFSQAPNTRWKSLLIDACFSHRWLFATLWTVVCQVSLSMGFSKKESWSGLPFPSPGDLPDPKIEPTLLRLLYWQPGSLLLNHQRSQPLLGTHNQ